MTTQSILKTNTHPVRLRYQLLAFATTRTIINTSYRMVYPFLPTIARGLGVDLQAITIAIMARSSLGVVGPLFGSIADRWGRKSAMLLGVGLFTLGMLLVTIWPTYPALFTALLLTSASKIIFDPAMQAYLGDRVQYKQRGLAIALTEFGWAGAFLLGIPIAGWLIARAGWNAPFLWLTLLGFGTMLILRRILPQDTPRADFQPSFWSSARIVLKHPPALAALAIGLLTSSSNELISIIYGVWMEEAFGLQVLALGAASAVIGFAELGGEGLVAGFVDRVGKRRAVALGIASYAGACVILPVLGTSLEGALLGLFLFYISFEFTLVSMIPLMTQLVPHARATLLSGNVAAFSLGRSVGAMIGPTIFLSGIQTSSIVATFCNVIALGLLLVFVKENPE